VHILLRPTGAHEGKSQMLCTSRGIFTVMSERSTRLVGFPKENPHWLSETEAYNDMAFKELAENGN